MNNYILEFWNSQAEKHGTSYCASWGDNFAIALEIDTINQYIKQNDEVLEVGCANGFTTFFHLSKKIRSIMGIDFSPAMIQEAKKAWTQKGSPSNVSFEVGDIRDIRFEDKSFDVVYTTRTLINLPTWDDQQKGINECVRVCKTGGTIVFCEAFWEPLMLLNAMRSLNSLAPLVEHDFNRYLKKKKLEWFLSSQGLNFSIVDFSSVYYIGSRFLREILTNPEDYPGYSNPINKIFYDLEKEYSGGGFGIQQAYVIKK